MEALGMKPFKPLVATIYKIKAVVTYFRHSNVAQDPLRKEQYNNNEGKKDGTYSLFFNTRSGNIYNGFYIYCLAI